MFVAVTLGVFWIAHVYAGAVAEHGTVDGQVVGLREAIRRSRGLVLSGLIPAFPLLLGVFGVLSDRAAAWAALVGR